MIASRARSDPIPLPLGSIPGPASVLLFESMNQPVSSTGGVSIVSTVWLRPVAVTVATALVAVVMGQWGSILPPSFRGNPTDSFRKF